MVDQALNRNRIAYSLAVIASASIIYWLSLTAISPPNRIPISPLPLLTLIPALIIGQVAALLPTIAFCLWSYHLFKGERQVPKRSFYVLGVILILDSTYFISNWKHGLKFQGEAFTELMAVVNGIFALILVTIAIWAAKKPGFILNLLYHLIMFTWIGWCALPFLGELP